MGRTKIRTLVVDDQEPVRRSIALRLSAEPDIEVVGQAGNGREALQLVADLHPDVVLMDVSMPGMDGVSATLNLRNTHPAIRIVALSMFVDHEVANMMKQAGADAYVCKGAKAEELLKTIRNCVTD